MDEAGRNLRSNTFREAQTSYEHAANKTLVGVGPIGVHASDPSVVAGALDRGAVFQHLVYCPDFAAGSAV